jgi:hypothetical protein
MKISCHKLDLSPAIERLYEDLMMEDDRPLTKNEINNICKEIKDILIELNNLENGK